MTQSHYARGNDLTAVRKAHDGLRELIAIHEKVLAELRTSETLLREHLKHYKSRAKTLEEVLAEYRLTEAVRRKDHIYTRLCVCLKNDLLFDYCVEDMLVSQTRASLMRIPNFGKQCLVYLEAALLYAGVDLSNWK